MNILVTWIGTQDLKAADASAPPGTGPLANAVNQMQFDEALILANQGEDRLSIYLEWLRPQTKTPLRVEVVSLDNPTDFRRIYQIADQAVAQLLEDVPNLTFHLSPGTSQMAASWMFLSCKHPATLIQSSKEAGVEVVELPFEISAELIAKGLETTDQALSRMSALLSGGVLDDIQYNSPAMTRLMSKAHKASQRSVPAYIEGEPGTEKLQLAKALHGGGSRALADFKHIDCAASSETEIDELLFGNQVREFPGILNKTNGGTLYLECIETLSPVLQAKLLREIVTLGSKAPRLIISSRINLLNEVTTGEFREDLFYALAVIVLKIPPLRERSGDLSPSIDHILAQINEQSQSEPGFEPRSISPSAKSFLVQHRWPGNMQELENTLRRAVVWSDGTEISEADVWDALLGATSRSSVEDNILGRPIEEGVDIQDQ